MTDKKDASLAATAFADSPPASQAIQNRSPGAESGVGLAAPPPSSSAEGPGPIGKTIHGRYRIKRLLGEGGMGGVYEGEHLEIGKRVAIKLVHALHARDPHIAARIKQEARSTGVIESENIVQVFDAGEDDQLGIFLVMELLKGEDLGALLARKKRVSPMAAATMVVQAAQGLARAHAAGIVHRDLKPANIFLCTRDDGSSLVKLVDFGIAKLLRDVNESQGARGLTRVGMVIGTPQYMSPEQAQGLPTVDHRTDIYSLGAVLFEAIVGTSPFPEMPTYEQTILQIMTRPAPRISQFVPDIHPDLDRLCVEMMAHDPAARPVDMTLVRERLLRLFPAIEGGRLPMRSLTNEAGYEATVAADTTGQLKAERDAAFARAGLSGVGLRVSQGAIAAAAATQSAVAVDPSSASSEPPADVAGLPKRRQGALIGAVAVIGLAIGIAGVALVKMKSEPAASTPAAGYGLVQATVGTPTATAVATAAAPVAVAPPPVVVDTPPKPVTPSPAPHAANAPAAKASDKGAHASNAASTKAAKGAPPAAAAAPAEKDSAAARPVGGTGMSTEF